MKKTLFFILSFLCMSLFAQYPHNSDVHIKGYLLVDEYVECKEGRFETLTLPGGGTIGVEINPIAGDALYYSGGSIIVQDPNAKFLVGNTDLTRSEYDPYSYGANNLGTADATGYFNSRCPGGDCGLVIHPTKGTYRIDNTITLQAGAVLKIDPQTFITGYGEIVGNNSFIEAGTFYWLDPTITISGTWNVFWNPVWFGGAFSANDTPSEVVDSVLTTLTGTGYYSDFANFYHTGSHDFKKPTVFSGPVSIGNTWDGHHKLTVDGGYIRMNDFIMKDSFGLRIGLTECNTAPNVLINCPGSYNHGNSFTTGGFYNVALTVDGLSPDLTGYANVLLGYYTGYNLTSGYNNIAIGESAMEHNTTVSNSIALGLQSLTDNNGTFNVGINAYAGRDAVGNYNFYAGFRSGNGNTGNNTVGIGGHQVLYAATCDKSIAIGPVNTGMGANSDFSIFLGNEVGKDYVAADGVLLIDHQKAAGDNYFIKGLMMSNYLEFNADVNVKGNFAFHPTSVPESSSATGSAGDFTWDASYIYVCIATNTWKRVLISTW